MNVVEIDAVEWTQQWLAGQEPDGSGDVAEVVFAGKAESPIGLRAGP